MSETYVIEPPEPKRKEMDRDRKLDRIIDLLTSRNSGDDDSGNADDSPEVTFEPDPDQLPTDAGDEEDESDDSEGSSSGDDDSGQGEGSHNVEDGRKERRFRHPSAKRHAAMIER